MRLLTKVTISVMGVVLVLSSPAGADESSVYFATGASNVKPAAINKVVKTAGGGATWHLTGFTDPRGSEEINRRLRASRAESVKRALMAAGVDEGNISVEEGSDSGEADPKTYWKLRRVSIRYEGGKGPVVAQEPTGEPDKQAAADDKKARAEQKRAEAAEARAAAAEKKRAAAEERKAAAEQARADAAAKKAEQLAKRDESKRAAAEAARAAAEAKKAERAQKLQAEADAKKAAADAKAEADAKKAAANDKKDPDGQRVAMRSSTTGSTDKEPTNTAGEPKKLEHIRLIYWKALNHGLWIIAKQKGFFEQEGFDAELKETDEDAHAISKHVGLAVAGGAEDTRAIQAGQKKYTAGAVCGYGTHQAMADGDPIVDIGSMIMMPESLLMKKELADELDNNIRAFKGKKIGDTIYGASKRTFKYNNVLRGYLEQAGLKDRQDYNILEFSDPNKEIAELAAGNLDVAKVFPPADIEFVRQHPDYVRVPFAKFFPYLPCCRQVVTREQLKQNRGKYVRLLRASIRAHQFTVQHPREAAEILAKWLGLSPSVVRQAIMTSYVNLTPDPMRKGVEMYQRTNDKFTGTKTATAEFIDTSLYRDALLGLQSEDDSPTSQGYYKTMISRYRANN